MYKNEIRNWIKNYFPENYDKMIFVGANLMRRDNEKSHLWSISTKSHESKCFRCQRTKKYWNEFPFTCEQNKNFDKPTISEILYEEEKLFEKLEENAGPIIEKFVKKMGLSARTFSYLKQTHGISLDFICDFLCLKISDYQKEFDELEEIDKNLSRAAQVKEIVVAK